MTVSEYLDILLQKARRDPVLRARLLASRTAPNPVAAFCAVCRDQGFPVYEMDLIDAGEAFTLPSGAAPMAAAKILRY